MIKVLFFAGVPIDDAATLYRAGLVAKKLTNLGYQVIFTSVSANFKKAEAKKVAPLSGVFFIGQAHYQAKKPFSTRERLGVGKTLGESVKTCFRFAKILREEKPDKVLVVTGMPVSLMVGLTAKILGFKTFIDIEDLVTGQMEAAGYPKFLVGIYGLIEKAWTKIFDKISVPSHYLAERYPGSILLPNMVELGLWGTQRSEKTGRLNQIVFVGQIGPYHGQMEVLQSLSPLLQKHEELKLVFVGGGENLKNLKLKIKNLKLSNQVILTGQISQTKVRKILATSLIGLLPLWNMPVHEARHPLKLLEYLASGLVVVTNAVGEAKRIIEDGQNGLLCPAGDIKDYALKIENLLENDKLRQRISQEATKTAEKFDVEKILPYWSGFLT